VPSSISNSERAIPAGAWRATWLVALVLAISSIAFLEYVTRAHHQRPTVPEDPVWWGLTRRTVENDPRVVAFVGSSRMKLAYSPEAFAAAAPEFRGVQLAINGAPSLGVLQDLANDEQFRGLAVVDLIEWDVGVHDGFTAAGPFVDRAHALWRAPGAVANRVVGSRIQEHLALLAVGGRPLLTSLLRSHRWPNPMWVVTDREGSSHGDYSLADPKALQGKREWRVKDFFTTVPTPEVWLATLDHDVEPLVRQIQARGGDVVILHLPISGVFAADFDQGYPRAKYWDVFATRSAAHVLHFRDIPEMAPLTAPDEMHLDQRDQATFTRSLVEALRARGYLKLPGSML
jgi:hypothetical protein